MPERELAAGTESGQRPVAACGGGAPGRVGIVTIGVHDRRHLCGLALRAAAQAREIDGPCRRRICHERGALGCGHGLDGAIPDAAWARAYFLKFWAEAFPPAGHDPFALARWLVRANTGPLFAFPHGADTRLGWLNPVIFGCFALGAIVLLRKRKSTTALLILPILLTLAASALRRYPYGMSARVNLYLVPSILILAAAGVSWICCRAAPVVASPKLIAALGCSLVLFAACRLGNDLGHPYRTPWDRTARRIARWFWEEMPVDAEVVCMHSDLGIPFRPTRWAYDGADQYLCYQRIYSRRHREGRQPGWDRISERRPLRCVLLSRLPEEVPGFRQWIDEHRDRYALKDMRIYPATRGSIVSPRSSTSCAISFRARRRSRRAERRSALMA